jgi:rpsU-divergently transcribed protein
MQATEGWTMAALHQAAKDLNLSPMFGGVCSEKDLVVHFIKTSNAQLEDMLQKAGPDFHQSTVADKTKLAVRWRLQMLSPYISTPTTNTVAAVQHKLRSLLLSIHDCETVEAAGTACLHSGHM